MQTERDQARQALDKVNALEEQLQAEKEAIRHILDRWEFNDCATAISKLFDDVRLTGYERVLLARDLLDRYEATLVISDAAPVAQIGSPDLPAIEDDFEFEVPVNEPPALDQHTERFRPDIPADLRKFEDGLVAMARKAIAREKEEGRKP